MDKTNALSLTGGGMFDGGWTPVWLIKDEFTDTVAAGSVNGTAATPGPGTRTATDTESKMSVGSGVLAIAGGAAFSDPALFYGAQTRATGLAVFAPISQASSTNGPRLGFFSGTTGLGGTWAHTLGFVNRQIYVYQADTPGRYVSDALAAATLHKMAVVARSIGANYLAYIDGAWKLLWISVTTNEATLYAGVLAAAGNAISQSADYLRVLQLPAPFDTDDGLATDTHSGSVAAGTTFTHEGNALIEATITTVPSADNIDIVFRQQDASNYWICRIATGGNISLQEVVAGTPTQRGVAAGVVSNGHRVVVIADGTTIKGYSNNVLRWTYSSATNFATATAGEVETLGTGGAVSDLKTWPRTLSGTAASILNKASG